MAYGGGCSGEGEGARAVRRGGCGWGAVMAKALGDAGGAR
ncbi:hypothetical protein L083_8170 [Actinoplanes sp. N902-109]|nr:hypothetical protein L083_8170 [Actinoplanes sp. N902-109]